jgi:hypothetical protein
LIARRVRAVALGLAALIVEPAAVAGGRPSPALAPYRVAITLTPHRTDHFLPTSPGPGQPLRIVLDARRAPPKTRLLFQQTLAAGRREVSIETRGASAAHTFVVALPLAPGSSVIVVTISGQGRFDLGFFAQGAGVPPREYRFTRSGPLPATELAVDMPAR